MNAHSQFEKVPHAVRVSVARESCEHRSAFRLQFIQKPRFPLNESIYGRCIVAGASGDQSLDSMNLDENPSSLEQLEHVAASAARGERDGRFVVQTLL